MITPAQFIECAGAATATLAMLGKLVLDLRAHNLIMSRMLTADRRASHRAAAHRKPIVEHKATHVPERRSS